MNSPRTFCWAVAAALLGGCGAQPVRQTPAVTPPVATTTPLPAATPAVLPPPISSRLVMPASDTDQLPTQATEQLYSFFARDFPIDQVLALFARAYKLNIVVDKDVTGTINVEFHDLPFDQAMEAMLGSLGYHWERDGGLVRVRSTATRTFTVDYIRVVRQGEAQATSSSTTSSASGGGTGSTANSGSSGASAGGGNSGGNGSEQGGGSVSVSQQGSVPFWDELETQLRSLLSPNARLVVNRTAGTIMVTDQMRRVREVGRYLGDVNEAVQRQVDIEVRIVEVSLNDDFSLGIDWQRAMSQFNSGKQIDFNASTIIKQPAGGVTPAANVFSLGLLDVATSGAIRLSGVIDALKQQGDVKVVSQPHIRTLNNQPGMIKVGTDRTFFRREQVTDTSAAGATTSSSDIPQIVTEGIVLGLTPQISNDGWIMMDVYPVITRVSSVTQVVGAGGQVQSTAPNLDIRQSSSLVRAQSGETIVIGGLISDTNSDTTRAVPGLGDIPAVGNLFKGRYNQHGKQELVIFLTPKLVGPSLPHATPLAQGGN
jgi:MSHA type pilus biogenesis protein MshL